MLNSLLQAFKNHPNDKETWSILSDYMEDNQINKNHVFLVIQSSVYRHSVVGIFKRLDAALIAGSKHIESEHDHYHGMEIIEIELDQFYIGEQLIDKRMRTDNEKPVAYLSWEWNDKIRTHKRTREQMKNGKVICSVSWGWRNSNESGV